jgi:uncharacterized iron-regulated membrane protein
VLLVLLVLLVCLVLHTTAGAGGYRFKERRFVWPQAKGARPAVSHGLGSEHFVA